MLTLPWGVDYIHFASGTIPANKPCAIRSQFVFSVKLIFPAIGAAKILAIEQNATSSILHFFFVEFFHVGLPF